MRSLVSVFVAGLMSAGTAVSLAGCCSSAMPSACCCKPCECGDTCNCVVGRWALSNCGWLGIEKDGSGAYAASLLSGGGSPVPLKDVTIRGNAFSGWRPSGKVNRQYVEGQVANGIFTGALTVKNASGKAVGNVQSITGKRIPALGKAPDLTKLEYGAPIALFADGLDGWTSMNSNAYFGWSFKDGVLSNRIRRDAKGKPQGANANIKTKRADFTDFKIRYEVRVPAGCNSGVYLRGIYELQVLDSYGKKVDCHNMAAPYGRITPCVAAEKPAGQWQTVEAILCDRHVSVWLNGTQIVDNQPLVGVTGGALSSDEFAPGPFYLQGDHSDADFRNMVVLPIVRK